MSVLRGEPVETLQRLRMSYEEYQALPEHVRAEWVDGEVVVTPSADFDHQEISFTLTLLLKTSLPALRIVEAVTTYLPHHRERIPDIVAVARRPEGTHITDTPVLVVEILSKSTRNEDTVRKSGEYLGAGIEQYWVVDPALRTIEVFESRGDTWASAAYVDESSPEAEVTVSDFGKVPLRLAVLDVD